MGEIVGVTFLAFLSAGTLAALLTIVMALLPGPVGQVRQAVATVPGRSFAVGLINVLFLLIIIAVNTQIGEAVGGLIGGLFSLAGLFLAWILFLLIMLGAAGVVALLKERLYRAEKATTPAGLNQSLRASILFVLAVLAPLFGWFILAPLALITGLGAIIMALVQRSRPVSQP